MKWKLKHELLQPATPEILKNTFFIQMDTIKSKCSVCGEPAFDHCSNCEIPLCRKHLLIYGYGMPFYLLSFCKECVTDYFHPFVHKSISIDIDTSKPNDKRLFVLVNSFRDGSDDFDIAMWIKPDGTIPE